MKCLILAAGYATRLYPLTENFPKPLLKVGDKTILDWLIDDIGEAADSFVVISNHKFAEHFEKWAEGRDNITVLDDGTSSNETRLGAVRDIQFAIESLGIDDDVLVIAGDNVLDFSLIGILSKISGILADHKIGIFAVSTYNTDYILVKSENFSKAVEVLGKEGYTII